MADRCIRVVSLWLHPGQEAAFEAFEKDAARLMARHGGRIDRAIRIDQPVGGAGDAPFEVHFVSFPDAPSFDAYASDPETLALRPRRNLIISRTLSFSGHEAGPY